MIDLALIGASGHGLWHRRTIHRLPGVRLAAVCDVRPPAPADGAPLDGVAVYADHAAMLAGGRRAVVVVCTPPHSHLSLALDAGRAGADLLLERRPGAHVAAHAALADALATPGRVCQVNFQALGAAAFDRFSGAVSTGAVGTV